MRRVAWALAAVAASASGQGDDAAVRPLPEIVVTAARLPQPLSGALQSTTVITAPDIERSGQQTLPAVLQRLGGVEIATTGGAGQPSAVFIRGANAAQTLVLVDGLRVGSATTGSTAFENIPLDQIERIEIVSGPLSSLYGADAIGGVIQIFTRSRGTTPAYGVSAGYGTWNTTKVNGSFNRSVGGLDGALTAGFEYSDQFDATRTSIAFDQHNPDRDPYRNANVSGKLAYRYGDGDETGVSAFYSEGKTRFDAGPDGGDANRQALYTYAVYSRNRLAPAWQSLLRIGRSVDDIVTTGLYAGDFRTSQDQAAWQSTFDAWGGTLIAGIEYLRQQVASDVAYATTSRSIRSALAGFAGDYGDSGIQLNVRYDDNSQFGGRTTGAIGYGYRIDDGLRLRASAGTAFQAPTFNDLYFPGFGNPDLAPAASRSWDAGFDWGSAAQRASFTYFENRISDLIVFDLATSLPENLARARIRGGTLAWQATLFDVAWRGTLTVQDPQNVDNGAQLPRRARKFGSVAASRSFGAWTLGVEWVGAGARYDSTDEDPATRMGGYAIVNLFASWRIAPAWTVELRLDNAADRDYELAKGYTTPGSNVFVWLRWRPGP